MSNLILPCFVWKLMRICDVAFRGCKYFENDKCRSMKFSQNHSNRDMLKVVKFGVRIIHCF